MRLRSRRRAIPIITHHWTYTPATGAVQSAVAGTTLDGVAYTAL
jgi:hypothetical protein